MTPAQWWKKRLEYLANRGWMPGNQLRYTIPARDDSQATAPDPKNALRPRRPPQPLRRPPAAEKPLRDLTTQEIFVRNILVFTAILLLAFVFDVLRLSAVQQDANQQKLRNDFRVSLSDATAPTSEGDFNNVLLNNGDPVAIIRIPDIGLDEVVVEGTDSGSLKLGPGHRRDTVLPGQAGTSVIMGRAWTYGGSFGQIDTLSPGAVIEFVTGQGFHTYQVIGVRLAGDPAPAAPAEGSGRVILESAHGSVFAPGGIVRVDAQMVATSMTDPDAAVVPRTRVAATAPSPQPSATASASASADSNMGQPGSTPSASPAPSASPSPGSTPTASPSPGSTPAASSTPTPSPTASAPATAVASSAKSQGGAFAAGTRFTFEQTLPITQREMATDTSQVLVLLFALQFLVVVELLTIWAYRRFGFERTWIAAAPVVFLAAIVVADQITLLLPNLI